MPNFRGHLASPGTIVSLTPGMTLAFVTLFCLIFAAHFLRTGAMSGVLVCLAIPLLAAITCARWALRSLQALLVVGSVNWIVTALCVGAERRAAGEPWMRMAIILGAVAGLTAMAAGMLSRRTVLERFRASPAHPQPEA